jgi:formylglycine-generating enzyme required for sulfatase activity
VILSAARENLAQPPLRTCPSPGTKRPLAAKNRWDTHPFPEQIILMNRALKFPGPHCGLIAAFVAFLSAGVAVVPGLAQPPATAKSGASSSVTNYVVTGLQLEMLWVKPGEFTNGSAEDEPFRDKAEGPRTHIILTQGFWLGKTEITQGQSAAIMHTNPSTFTSVGSNAPADNVSWLDAMEFCQVLNERERQPAGCPRVGFTS